MHSPFRSFSARASSNQDPGSMGSKPGEVMCPKHPRSWVERRVFFVTKTRLCPHCDLESYAEQGADAPCEPGFGGTAPPERRPSGPSRTPRSRSVGTPTPRRRENATTPRAGGGVAGGVVPAVVVPGGKGGFTPRADGERNASGGSTPRTTARGRGGRGTPAGAGTPRERGQARGGHQTPQTVTIARRTAVFNPTQNVAEPKGRPPRQGQHGRSLSYAAGSTRGMPRSRHHRTSSAPSRHQRRKKVVGEGRRPSSARSARGGSGGSGGSGGFSREMSAPSPRAEGAARFVSPPSTAPAKLTAGPNMQARSLMFTSAARKRGGGGDNAARGAASPARGAAPPSPSGSALSACSDLSAVSGGSALDGDPVRRPPVNLTLPLSIDESSSRSGVHPVVSVVTVAAPESSSVAGGSAARRRGAGGGGGGGPPWTVMTTRATTATSADTAKVVVPSPAPAPAPTDVVAAVERLESPSARERMRPAAAAVAELWTALRALRPARVGGLGGADQVVEAAGAASSAVKGANALMNATEDGGGGDGGGGGEEVMDEEAAEAAGALLAQAGDAVETLAQIARALVWSGKDPLKLGEIATYAGRHRSATEAVAKAATRTGLLVRTLTADDGKGPKERAEAQRRWFSMLDRHEAWIRRRDSRKGLLMAEPEIPAGSVTVFKDSQLLSEGTFGTTYAAEYLGMPMFATVLPIRTSGSKAGAQEVASARLLRRSATSELRMLASLVPPHQRLVRTHGSESIPARAPLRAVNKSKSSGSDQQGGRGEEQEKEEEGPPALVFVSDMVDGGSLRDRINAAAAAAAAAAASEGATTAGVFVVIAEENTADANAETAAAAAAGGGGGTASTKAEETENGKALSPSVEGDEVGAREAPEPVGEEASARRRQQQQQQQGRLLLRRRKVLADIAEGLAYLHDRGVAHGALATDNVLLDAEGRAKLYLFGLPETRQAVVSLKVTAISVSPSEDRDALATKEAAAAVPGVIDATGGVWTPPETWMALVAKQAVATAAAEKEEEKDAEAGDEPGAAMVKEDAAAAAMAAAEGLEANSQAAFAADAYAFGMVSWEVLTGDRPWEGLTQEEMSTKVRQGERPPLPFDPTSLDGFDNFGDLVRRLWAQDPKARPALQDVARHLRVPEPHRAPSAEAVATAAAKAAEGSEVGVEPDVDDVLAASDADGGLAASLGNEGSEGQETSVHVEEEWYDAEAGAEVQGNEKETSTAAVAAAATESSEAAAKAGDCPEPVAATKAQEDEEGTSIAAVATGSSEDAVSKAVDSPNLMAASGVEETLLQGDTNEAPTSQTSLEKEDEMSQKAEQSSLVEGEPAEAVAAVLSLSLPSSTVPGSDAGGDAQGGWDKDATIAVLEPSVVAAAAGNGERKDASLQMEEISAVEEATVTVIPEYIDDAHEATTGQTSLQEEDGVSQKAEQRSLVEEAPAAASMAALSLASLAVPSCDVDGDAQGGCDDTTAVVSEPEPAAGMETAGNRKEGNAALQVEETPAAAATAMPLAVVGSDVDGDALGGCDDDAAAAAAPESAIVAAAASNREGRDAALQLEETSTEEKPTATAIPEKKYETYEAPTDHAPSGKEKDVSQEVKQRSLARKESAAAVATVLSLPSSAVPSCDADGDARSGYGDDVLASAVPETEPADIAAATGTEREEVAPQLGESLAAEEATSGTGVVLQGDGDALPTAAAVESDAVGGGLASIGSSCFVDAPDTRDIYDGKDDEGSNTQYLISPHEESPASAAAAAALAAGETSGAPKEAPYHGAAAAAHGEGTTDKPTLSQQQSPVGSASAARPVVSYSPLGSTDSSPTHRVDELLRLSNDEAEEVVQASSNAMTRGVGIVKSTYSRPPVLAAPSCSSFGDNADYCSASEGRSPATLAYAAETRQAAEVAAAEARKSNAEVADAAPVVAPFVTVPNAGASSSSSSTIVDVITPGDVVVNSDSNSTSSSSTTTTTTTTATSRFTAPRKQPSSSFSTSGGGGCGSGSLPVLSSPDLSQLSVTSRGGATVMMTPPPPPQQAQRRNHNDQRAVVSVAGNQNRRNPEIATTTAEMGAGADPGTPTVHTSAEAGSGGGSSRVMGPPSTRQRAGTKLWGLKKMLSRFGKKDKDDGGGGSGVTGFPLQER